MDDWLTPIYPPMVFLLFPFKVSSKLWHLWTFSKVCVAVDAYSNKVCARVCVCACVTPRHMQSMTLSNFTCFSIKRETVFFSMLFWLLKLRICQRIWKTKFSKIIPALIITQANGILCLNFYWSFIWLMLVHQMMLHVPIQSMSQNGSVCKGWKPLKFLFFSL